jgi:hypothetical protein
MEASDLLAPPTKVIAYHQSTRRAAASRAKPKWLEKLATRASDLLGQPRVRGSLSDSSARRRATAPVALLAPFPGLSVAGALRVRVGEASGTVTLRVQ